MYTPPKKQNRLIALLRERHITRKALADRVGVSVKTINNKLSGRTPFQFWEVRILCDFLGLGNPLDWFD